MAMKSLGNPQARYNAVWGQTGKGAASEYISKVEATGGNSTSTFTQDGVDYKAHIFTDSSTDLVVTSPGAIDVLVVGGGGGGGSGASGGRGGGGGGGAVIHETDYTISAGTYPVTIGAGGEGGAADPGNPGNPGVVGSNTSIGSLFIALGGGFGASNVSDAGGPGGSGGGGAGNGSGPAGSENPGGSTAPPGASILENYGQAVTGS